MRIWYILIFIIGLYFLHPLINYINLSVKYKDPSEAIIIDIEEP